MTDSLNIGAGLSHIAAKIGITYTKTYSETNCIGANLTNHCKWEDGKCHALWGSDQVTRMWGYIERHCDYAKDNAPEFLIWSHDFIIDVPTGSIATGCRALCNQGSYEVPKRATSLSTLSSTCKSAATWSAATQTRATEKFSSSENPTTAWANVLDYTSGGATGADTSTSSAMTATNTKAASATSGATAVKAPATVTVTASQSTKTSQSGKTYHSLSIFTGCVMISFWVAQAILP
jgi:hypothetical protein